MVTNRKFKLPKDAQEVDLRSKPPGPPPKPGMVWFGPEIGWKRVVVDDPEDRKPLPPPRKNRAGALWADRISKAAARKRR